MHTQQIQTSLLGLLAALALILAACGPAATETASPISTPPPSNAEEETEAGIPAEAQELVDMVKQDLSEQLNVPVEEIQVVQVRAEEWPDSSMGCPKPGFAYLDVITPGYEIILQAEGQKHTYHTGTDAFVLCDGDSQMEEPTSAKPTPKLGATVAALAEQAMKDLSERTGVAVDQITIVSAEAVDWPDSSMGCPQPGMNYLMVITPGYLILLEANGQVYYYQGDAQSVSYCKDPKPPLSASPQAEGRVVKAAQTDLAQRIGISTTDIEVVRVQAVSWPDASLGCPEPGKMYAQVVTPGYQVILSAQGQEYDYRTTMETAILCQQTEQ